MRIVTFVFYENTDYRQWTIMNVNDVHLDNHIVITIENYC